MAKKKQRKTVKAVNTTPTYEVGQELIFSDERTIMESCTIANIQDSGYILSNGVKVNFDLIRNDGRDGHCLPKTEETQSLFEAWKEHQVIGKLLYLISKKIEKMDKMNLTLEEAQEIHKVNKSLNKLNNIL